MKNILIMKESTMEAYSKKDKTELIQELWDWQKKYSKLLSDFLGKSQSTLEKENEELRNEVKELTQKLNMMRQMKNVLLVK